MLKQTSASRHASNDRAAWQADLAPIGITIGDDPAARPALLLVMADGQIIGFDLVTHPEASARAVAILIETAIRAAIAKTGEHPSRVQVRDGGVAAELSARFAGDAIAVGAADSLEMIDHALDDFERNVGGRPAELGRRPLVSRPRTWAGWDLEPAQVAALFSAAATYYRAAPWTHVVNDDFLKCSVRGGGKWAATVMGNAGEVFGLALYAREDDLFALLYGDPDDPMAASEAMKGEVISFSFERRADMSPEMQKEVRAAKWELAGPAAYPSLLVVNAPGGGITARAMEDLIAILTAVPRFTAAHEAALSGTIAASLPLRWRDGESGVSITFDSAMLDE